MTEEDIAVKRKTSGVFERNKFFIHRKIERYVRYMSNYPSTVNAD